MGSLCPEDSPFLLLEPPSLHPRDSDSRVGPAGGVESVSLLGKHPVDAKSRGWSGSRLVVLDNTKPGRTGCGSLKTRDRNHGIGITLKSSLKGVVRLAIDRGQMM